MIKIITLWQPWASLIAEGHKQYETRSWSTDYRGKLAIHAAKRPLSMTDWETAKYNLLAINVDLKLPKYEELSFGCIVAIADLVSCQRMTNAPHPAQSEIGIHQQTELEIAVGDWAVNRFAWGLENIAKISPLPYTGAQGLRNLPESVIEQVGAIAL